MIGRIAVAGCLAVVSVFCSAQPAQAQMPVQSAQAPALVRYGKWAALGAAVASTALGIHSHNSANTAFNDLRDYCGATGSCALGTDGRYADAGAEALYREVSRGDRRARTWLIAGQAALIGSVALFVIDLSGRGRPGNEPFSGLVVAPGVGGATLIGLRLPVR